LYHARVQAKPRDPLPANAVTLPAKYYTDPALFGRELELFYTDMWVCAGRAADVSRAGDYVLRDIAGESIIVLRDADGTLRAFYNVCRHRGTRLCTQPAGALPGRIQCPYHSWTYRLDGSLESAPHMEDVAGFRLEDHPLHGVGIGVWDGHVFANLRPERAAPLETQLADLPENFRAWQMAALERAERLEYDVQANWKLIVQNYSECLHCPNLHPALNRLSHYLSGENEPPRPTYLGGRMDLRPGVGTMSMDGRRPRACLPGLPADDTRRVYYSAVLPNLLLTLHPDYMMTSTLWPLAPDRTHIVCEWHFHPDETAKPGFDAADAVEFWDLTNRQDWHICEQAQAGIASRAYRPGPYSNREDLLYAFDRLILEVHERKRLLNDKSED
jgi:Rieske 2Fe-2S family protein